MTPTKFNHTNTTRDGQKPSQLTCEIVQHKHTHKPTTMQYKQQAQYQQNKKQHATTTHKHKTKTHGSTDPRIHGSRDPRIHGSTETPTLRFVHIVQTTS